MGLKKTLLIFVLSLLVGFPLYFFTFLIPVSKFNEYYNQAPLMFDNLINQSYPEDLVIDIKNGEVSVNRVTPYCLVLEQKSKFGILFDENANAADFISKKNNLDDTCKPYALVGKNFVVVPDTESGTEGSYRIQEISSSVNYTITRDEISKLAATILPKLMNFAKYTYYIGPFVLAIFIFPFFLLMNLWYALIARLLLKITKTNAVASYKEVYAKSLFVLFIITVINWLLIELLLKKVLNLNFTISFPFLMTILVAIGTFLMEKFVFKKNQQEPPPVPAPPVPINQTETPEEEKVNK